MTADQLEAQRVSLMKNYGGDEHFLHKTWENFRVDASNAKAAHILRTLQLGKHPGAYIRGPVGSGKTHAMKAMLNYFIDWKAQLLVRGDHSPVNAYWAKMSFYLDELRHENWAIKKRAQQATILFLDDVGTSTKTDWVTDQVFQLIDYRDERELQTVMTSNLKLADLEPIYGDRVVSRIHSMCVIVDMAGKDHRKEQLQINFDKVLKNMNKPTKEEPSGK